MLIASFAVCAVSWAVVAAVCFKLAVSWAVIDADSFVSATSWEASAVVFAVAVALFAAATIASV